MKKAVYKFAAGLALVAALFPLYVELAVGIIDPPGGPLVLMELGILLILIVGSTIARFRPKGMAIALFVAALAQTLIAIISLIALPGHPASPPLEILGINGLFIALFIGSGLLFRFSTQKNRPNAESTD